MRELALAEAEGVLEVTLQHGGIRVLADDREDLIDSMEAVRDAMAAESDAAALPQAMAALADVLYYLEN